MCSVSGGRNTERTAALWCMAWICLNGTATAGIENRRSHIERAWSYEELEELLRETGFTSVQRYGGLDRRPVCEADRRIYYVCVNGEGGQTPGQCPARQ